MWAAIAGVLACLGLVACGDDGGGESGGGGGGGKELTIYSSLPLQGPSVPGSDSGEPLQLLLQTPLALGVMSAVLVLLSLSMFGLFEIQLPAAFVERIAGAASEGGRGPLAVAAVLGFGSWLIGGP